jgi:N-acyl-phosphatidylethanolamine-hydrolysing phospholipase D
MRPPRSLRLVALALALALAPAARAGDPALLGPAPRDADGHFLNTAGPLEQAGPSVTLPFFLRRFAGAFRSRPGAPPRVENDGAFLRENARHSTPTVTWIGHATLLVQSDHVTFLTDPTWSNTASPVRFAGPRRFVPPGLELEALPALDFVLVSHNHYDHLDLPTLSALAERHPQARFFVPLGNGELLRTNGIERVEELDWGESRRHAGVEIHCLPAQHWSRRGLRDGRKALWASWAVTGPHRRLYFAGDTGYFDGFARIAAELGPFDLAALPIGAYLPEKMMRVAHLDPEEAIRAGLDLRARRVLGIHFGTFDLSDEPLDEPPRRFRAAGAEAGLAEEDVWVLAVGETRRF